MTENLHNHLVSTLRAAGVNPALSEDEIEGYPYVTFELPVEYRYDKDGPYKIVGNLTIRAVSDDFDEADALRASIERAIAEGFNGEPVIPVEEAGDPVETQEEVELEEPTEEEVIEEDPGEEPTEEEVIEEDPGEEAPEEEVIEEDPGEEAPEEEVIEEDPGEEPTPEELEEVEDDRPSDPVTGTIYTARLTDVRKDCTDGIWVIELDYILNQI
jgi:hypothetical protein